MRASILPPAGRSSFGLGNTRAKRRPRAALAAIALAAFSGTASATTYIYEPFDYGAGQPLLNQTDASSGNRAWVLAATTVTSTTALNTSNPTASLNGPVELPPSIGNSLAITGIGNRSGSANRLSLGTNVNTATSLYYSFALRVDALTGSNNGTGGFFFSLNNSANATTNDPTVAPARMQGRIDPVDSTKFDIGVFNNRSATSTDSQWSGSLIVGQTYFVVGATDLGSGGLSASNARLWVNPSPTSFGLGAAPAADRTDTVAGATWTTGVQSVFVRQSPAPYMTMDELRVANSWAEVTPTRSEYWDINGATAGAGGPTPSGTWDSATSNWNLAAAGDATGITWAGAAYKAVFAAGTDATGAYTVTVSGTQSATGLSFEEGTVTLTGGTVNLSQGVIDASTSSSVSIASGITGASGLSKISGGTVILTGSMGYTGNTTISAGTLQIGNGSTAGALPTTSVITNNGTLIFNRSDTVTQGTDFNGDGISGSGNLTQAGAGMLILNTANTYTGTTKATASTLQVSHSLALQNSTVDTSGAGSIVFDNALTSATVGGLSGATNYSANSALSITISGNIRNASFGGVISGTGSVTKNGSINQELSGLNTYTGGTNVNAGILQFGATNSMPATGTVTVNSGGVLAIHVGGAGEWTTGTSGIGTVGGLIAGDGGQTASQVVWNDGSSLGINTQPVGTTTNTADITYGGDIGNFNGVSDATKSVGFMKRGYGTLTLSSSNNTFRGQLQVANEGGTLRLPVVLPNAGQSMAIPTVYVGNATGANNTILKILTNNAVPTNSVINFGSAAGSVNPIFRLHDADPTGTPPTASFNQTIRGVTGGGGVVQVGAGTLTIDTPTGETYTSSAAYRTEADSVWNGGDEINGIRGKIIKTGLGEQDLTQFNQFQIGEFVLQNGTIGFSDQQVFGYSGAQHSKLTLNGGKLINRSGGSQSLQVKFVEIANSFTFDVNGNGNSQFTNDTVTLTAPNPTITVINSVNGGTGQFIFLSKVTDNGAGYGFTKAGPGTLNLNASGIAGNNNYSGATTIQQGNLRVVEFSIIGNGSSDVNLSGGTLEYNGSGATNARLFNVTNPTHVTANSSIIYNSTTAGLTDVTDPNGVVFEFSNNTLDRTGGTLTLQHQGTSQGITFRPRFSGNGFNYTGPVVISNGAGTRKTVMESTNATGTQTWSGDITGNGSYSRGTGGTTVFAGQLVSIGGVTVADNSKIQLAESVGNDRVIRTANLTIGSTSSQLDLSNNKLITQAATGTWNGSMYTDVTGMIASGRNGGGWAGSGIVTSQTSATTGNLTSIGVAKASDVRPATLTATATWAGQTITGTDTLVMYTYGGDANLDGKINIDDYIRIDAGFAGHLTGWSNGDFNYDGVVNIDDYLTVIDANFPNQTLGTFFTAGGIGGEGLSAVSAVPEPGAVGLLFTALGVSFARRMHRRRRIRSINSAT